MPEVTTSALYGMLDLLSSAGRDFLLITKGIPGEQRMRPCIVARTRDEFRAANGVLIRPDYDFDDCPTPDIVCIPDFFANLDDMVAGGTPPRHDGLRTGTPRAP